MQIKDGYIRSGYITKRNIQNAFEPEYMTVLRTRYERGDISKEEYEKIRKILLET